jgi:MFS family permease
MAGTHQTEAGNAYPGKAYAWYVVVVLTLAYMVSFIDRQILALLIGPVKADLGLSDTQISLLLGLAFGIFYTLMGIPLGRLADRRSRRAIIAAGITFWCLMTAACGLARNYAQLFMARVGVGVGEASLTPSALSLISDYFPRGQRGRAIGFYNMGISLGVGVAMTLGGFVVAYALEAPPLELPLVGELFPWQRVFLLVGLPGLLIAVLMLTVREPARRGLHGQDSGQALPLRYVVSWMGERWRMFTMLLLGMSVVTIIGYAYFSWIPTMFIRSYGWSVREIGVSYGVLLLICGPFGVLSGGWLADTLYARGYKNGHLLAALTGNLITLPSAVMVPLMPSGELALAMLVPASIGPAMSSATGASALVTVIPNQMRAQITAVYLFVISILGLTIGPTAVALVTDYVFADEAALRYSIAIVSGVAGALSSVVLFGALAHYRGAVDESEQWTEQ